ncbi:cyclin G2 [Schistosoma japonicum]|nr:cyclin G2 [Schistosoma japonicum]
MMVTSSRNVTKVFGLPTNNVSGALLSSAKPSRKGRRLKKPFQIPGSNSELHHEISVSSHCLPLEDDLISTRGLSSQNFNLCTPTYSPNIPYQAFYHTIQERLFTSLSQENLLYVNNEHLLAVNSLDDKIDASLRAETLYKLWSLHSAYYSLSPITFCKAVYIMDLFIAKVKVKPKYAMCVAAACYYITSKFERSSDHVPPTPESLVTLSRCGGTAADLTRMVEIILTKLGPSSVAAIGACSATAIDFLSIFSPFGILLSSRQNESDNQDTCLPVPISICRQIELALISSEASCFRPSCLALAFLNHLCFSSSSASPGLADDWLQFHTSDLFNLALICNVSWTDVDACSSTLKAALSKSSGSYTIQDYPSSHLLGSSPPLVWTLSRRTQRSISTSSPPALSTIAEIDENPFHLDDTFSNMDLGLW